MALTGALIGAVALVVSALLGGPSVTINNDGRSQALGATAPVTSAPVTSTSAPVTSMPAPPVVIPIIKEAPVVTINGPAQVRVGGGIALSGTATGLDGKLLWLVLDGSKSDYPVVLGEPLPVRDGRWSHAEGQVGNSSDIGATLSFMLYLADPACSTFFTTAPRDADGLHFFSATDMQVKGPTCGPSAAHLDVMGVR